MKSRDINEKKADLVDDTVRQLLKLIDGTPTLANCHLVEKLNSAAMSPDELETRNQARRAHFAKEAALQLTRFEAMSPEDKKSARHDGEMNHYMPEAQAQREALFEDSAAVNAVLDDWWRAAETYIDRDKNGVLTKDEYAVFHRRLLRIVQESEEDKITDEEAEKMMHDDFEVDAGPDGEVTMEEFRYAVFQLADHWTDDIDEQEYVEFLKRGFKVRLAITMNPVLFTIQGRQFNSLCHARFIVDRGADCI